MQKRKPITRQQRAAKTRKKNAALTRDAFRQGRRKGWNDTLHAWRTLDTEGFQDWLFGLLGVDE